MRIAKRSTDKSWLIIIVSLLLICSSTATAFVVTTTTKHAGRSSIQKRRKQSRLFVFERMSQDVITAIVASQEQAQSLGVSSCTNQMLMYGIADVVKSSSPMKRTFEDYRINKRNIQRVLQEMYSNNNFSLLQKVRQQQTSPEDVSFSPALKKTLAWSGKLATEMSSETIELHHLFLASLEYKEISSSNNNSSMAMAAAPVQTDGSCSCGAWQVLDRVVVEPKKKKTKKLADDDDDKTTTTKDKHVTALDVCQTLLEYLLNSNKQDDLALVGAGGAAAGSDSIPTLRDCSIDLTQQAREGLLDVVVGRDDEIRACLRTLKRRRKNNVCLIGEAGVGKTAIAEGVARYYVEREENNNLNIIPRVMALDMAQLVAGTKYRGEFEERLQAIVQEITSDEEQQTILFLDEVHTLVGAGAVEGGMDAANVLKPALARGQLQVLGATTIAEYRKYIAKDAALERRFQPLLVAPPTTKQTLQMLEEIAEQYQEYHGVKYTSDSLRAAVDLADRYIADRYFPDKAIDLLDEAGAMVALENNNDDDTIPTVTQDDMERLVSEWTKIPVGQLHRNERQRLQNLQNTLERRVKGQIHAVHAVARAMKRARVGLHDPHRPLASFLFCGPTGTGKTELCKTLAETYFGKGKQELEDDDEQEGKGISLSAASSALIRLDMSEYMDKHTVSRLTGPPPGYIGYEEGGQLTEAVRKAPHSVVLLDELEKAHDDVLNILLQLLEDGILTDGKGRTISFKNVVLVMTSNIGSSRILQLCNAAREEQQQNNKKNAVVVAEETTTAVATPVATTMPSATAASNDESPNIMSPEQVLSKMQNNPKALELMRDAIADSSKRQAMQTALSKSPADLLKLAQKDPSVAGFLQQVWSVLEDDDVSSLPVVRANGDDDINNNNNKSSGLEAIRSSTQASLSNVNENNNNIIVDGDDIDDDALYQELSEVVKEELEGRFKPELLNRMDDIVVFEPLTRKHLQDICQLALSKIVMRARSQHELKVEMTPAFVDVVCRRGAAQATQFGARPMRRAAQRYLEDALSEGWVQAFLEHGDEVLVDYRKHETAVPIVCLVKNYHNNKNNKDVLEVPILDVAGGMGGGSSSASRKTRSYTEVVETQNGAARTMEPAASRSQ